MIASLPVAHSALMQVDYFKGIDASVILNLAQNARVDTYNAGETVTRFGQHFHHLAVIAEGKIEISIVNRAGKRHVLSVFGTGEVYGLIPMLDGEPLYYGATALTPCILVMVPREQMIQSMHLNVDLMMAVFKLMCRRSRVTFEVMADRNLRSLAARLARHIVILACEQAPAASQDQGPKYAKFSQRELSEMMGVSRQSLNQAMKDLESRGMIHTHYSKIEIRDIDALKQVINDEL